jgi:hypothetical protein
MLLYLEDRRTVFDADILWNMRNSGGLVIPPSYFTEVTAAVSVMRVFRAKF